MMPPATGWQPPRIVEPAAPRALPTQDHPAIDAAEERAHLVTRMFGLAAGVAVVVLIGLLCGRAIF